MSARICLSIASVRIEIRGSGKRWEDYVCSYHADPTAPGREFVSRTQKPAQISIMIVETGCRPCGQKRSVFQVHHPRTGLLDWQIYRISRGYFYRTGTQALGFGAVMRGNDLRRIQVYSGQRSPRYERIVGEIVHHMLQVVLARYLAVHRLGVIMHAAAIVDSAMRSCVYAGVSGSGKSTICRLLKGYRGNSIVADDRLVIRYGRGVYQVYSCPWGQGEDTPQSRPSSLRALFVLKRMPKISGSGWLNLSEAIASMYPAMITAAAWDARTMSWQASFLNRMAGCFGVRRLQAGQFACMKRQAML